MTDCLLEWNLNTKLLQGLLDFQQLQPVSQEKIQSRSDKMI